jgi:hypothetical protein
VVSLSRYVPAPRSPRTGSALRLGPDCPVDEEGHTFPIVNGIPRFVDTANCANSFGYQWNAFRRVQLDGDGQHGRSATRLSRCTRWLPSDRSGKTLPEVGSGAGRFTEVLLDTDVELYTVDLSTAVDANWENNRSDGNSFLARANLFSASFYPRFFDFVLCLGVLQRTPAPALAFRRLVGYVKIRMGIIVDTWKGVWKPAFNTRYWFRPVTTRMDHERLLALVEWYVPVWFPVFFALLHVPLVGRFLSQIIPILNYTQIFPELSRSDLVQRAILDTFDMRSPKHDKPQSLRTLRRWAEEAGLEVAYCDLGDNGYALVVHPPAPT